MSLQSPTLSGQGTIHIDISLDSNAVIADIKKAIEMIKGITGVRIWFGFTVNGMKWRGLVRE